MPYCHKRESSAHRNQLLEGRDSLGTERVAAQIQVLQMQVLQTVHEHLAGVLRLVEGKAGNRIGQIQLFQFRCLGEGI